MQKTKHQPAQPYSEFPGFVEKLSASDGTAAQALLFTMLTTARTSEVTGAKWQEIDINAGQWTVPSERMKATANTGRRYRPWQ